MDARMTVEDPTFPDWWREQWSQVEADITLTLGVEPVSASDVHVELAMDFRPEIAQMAGMFSAGALIQLADNAATALCKRVATNRGQEGFPFSVQMNAHLVSNARGGRVHARAALLSAGRQVMVAETRVADETGKLFLLLTSTHVVKPSG